MSSEDQNRWEEGSISRETVSSNTSKYSSLAEEFDSFFAFDSEKESWLVNADWEELKDSVMDWFQKKGVAEGSPSHPGK
jgi:hypothetical protein